MGACSVIVTREPWVSSCNSAASSETETQDPQWRLNSWINWWKTDLNYNYNWQFKSNVKCLLFSQIYSWQKWEVQICTANDLVKCLPTRKIQNRAAKLVKEDLILSVLSKTFYLCLCSCDQLKILISDRHLHSALMGGSLLLLLVLLLAASEVRWVVPLLKFFIGYESIFYPHSGFQGICAWARYLELC